jgi:hypothetical protein
MTFDQCRICKGAEFTYEHGGVFMDCRMGAKMHLDDCGWFEYGFKSAITNGKLHFEEKEIPSLDDFLKSTTRYMRICAGRGASWIGGRN